MDKEQRKYFDGKFMKARERRVHELENEVAQLKEKLRSAAGLPMWFWPMYTILFAIWAAILLN